VITPCVLIVAGGYQLDLQICSKPRTQAFSPLCLLLAVLMQGKAW